MEHERKKELTITEGEGLGLEALMASATSEEIQPKEYKAPPAAGGTSGTTVREAKALTGRMSIMQTAILAALRDSQTSDGITVLDQPASNADGSVLITVSFEDANGDPDGDADRHQTINCMLCIQKDGKIQAMQQENPEQPLDWSGGISFNQITGQIILKSTYASGADCLIC